MNRLSMLERKERKRLFFVVSMWGVSLLTYVRVVMERIPVLNLFSDLFIPAAIIGIVLYSISGVLRKVKMQDVVLSLSLAFVFSLQFVLFTQNTSYLEENALPFLVGTLPFLFVGIAFDSEKDLPYMEIVSVVTIVLGVFYMLYKAESGILGEGENTENMGRAYAYLPHCLLLLHTTIKKFNLWRLFFWLVSIFIILGTGNRGSLVVVLVCAVLEFLFIKHYKRPVLSKSIVLVVALVILSFWNPILEYLFDMLETVGLSNRSLRFIVEGEFIADSNGRDNIVSTLSNALRYSPIFGYGICGDRLLTGGLYAHNLLLELLISFGPILGALLFCLILYAIIKCYFKCKNESDKGLWSIMIGCGFVTLFISDSFLVNKYFFMMLGFCLSIIRTASYKQTVKPTNVKYEENIYSNNLVQS